MVCSEFNIFSSFLKENDRIIRKRIYFIAGDIPNVIFNVLQLVAAYFHVVQGVLSKAPLALQTTVQGLNDGLKDEDNLVDKITSGLKGGTDGLVTGLKTTFGEVAKKILQRK